MRFILHALAFIILSAGPALAQTTATLVGHAEDATGGRLPGVSIIVTSGATGAARQTVTDAEGRFVLAGLPAGDYVVRAEIAGFRPLVRSGVRLTVGEHASLVLTLAAGATEDVQVSGGAGQVNTRSSELSYLVDQRTIERKSPKPITRTNPYGHHGYGA